ncbi:ABC transporter permease [Actinocorallia populi]|uniref:ABC transporter permease n=1 Tax=Actinocorallia populi TaxID=2079200 RepID=UPI0018E541FC|nr:ABC transporter permease [Actinocorallia populi]
MSMLSPVRSAAVPRLLALGRAEMLLLGRNRTALLTSVAFPAIALAMLATSGMFSPDDAAASAQLMAGTIGMTLLFVVYTTLVAAYVGRREGLVLKRLRVGELHDGEILLGTALPALAITVVQILILAGVGLVFLDVVPPKNPVLLLAGLVLGMVITGALAACSSAFTSTVETAQVTVLPFILLSVGGAGMFVPLSELPDPVAEICAFLPFTPVMETVRSGWAGTGEGGTQEAVRQVGMSAVWAVVSVWGARRWFRWEPRR